MQVKDNNILFYLPGGISRCGPTSQGPFLWNTHCNFTKVKLHTPNEVAVDGAVRWHQHVSGKTNTRRQQNLSFPDQRATLLRSHSSVYPPWKHQDQFLLICSCARFGPFTRRCRILGLCPLLEVGSLNPGLHPALSEIWSPNQTACVSRSWTPEKLLSACGCLKIIVGLKLGTGWGLERECGIFQCCVISMFYCFPSPNGWLQDSGKSPERWTLTVGLALWNTQSFETSNAGSQWAGSLCSGHERETALFFSSPRQNWNSTNMVFVKVSISFWNPQQIGQTHEAWFLP